MNVKIIFLCKICQNSEMFLTIYISVYPSTTCVSVSQSINYPCLSISHMCLCPCIYHCATSRKIAGSIPDVIRIFHLLNPSGRTMALGSTQPLTEMSTRDISLGVKAAGA
jgi:hypothetical protein